MPSACSRHTESLIHRAACTRLRVLNICPQKRSTRADNSRLGRVRLDEFSFRRPGPLRPVVIKAKPGPVEEPRRDVSNCLITYNSRFHVAFSVKLAIFRKTLHFSEIYDLS